MDQPSGNNLIAYLQLRRNYRTHKKTLDPGFRRDDGRNFTAATTMAVIPSQAGIDAAQRRWIPPCRAHHGEYAITVSRTGRMRPETPAPSCAGMTVVIEKTVKYLPSSPACDDCCVGGSHAIRIPHSLPAKAGIQRLSSCTSRSNLLLTAIGRGPGSSVFTLASIPKVIKLQR
jgi:hypothetical protein